MLAFQVTKRLGNQTRPFPEHVVHPLALTLIYQAVPSRMYDEPAYVLTSWINRCLECRHTVVRVHPSKRVFNEPRSVPRKAREQYVDVVYALRHDDCGRGLDESIRCTDAPRFAPHAEEHGTKHVCGATVADQKEPARFPRQTSPVSLVPRKHELEEAEEILGVCWVMEVIVWGGFPGSEPIVGNRDGVPCG